MDRATVLRKIRACLNLGKSSNAHEAAAALRQAQKMMAEYDIDQADVADAERDPIVETDATRRGQTTPVYIVSLMNLIARTFGVENFAEVGLYRTRLVFVGPEARASVAVYAFTVLLRQLERDRRAHMSRVRKAKNRAARGDVFGFGWVRGAAQVVSGFAAVEKDDRIVGYLERKHPTLTKVDSEARKSNAVGFGDVHAGRAAGEKAQLSRGVAGSGQLQLESQP